MKDRRWMEGLLPEERVALCRRILEGLSDLIEGQARHDLEIAADEIMRDRAGFRALCETLSETIDLARECGEPRAGTIDDDRFRRCVDRVRQRLEQKR